MYAKPRNMNWLPKLKANDVETDEIAKLAQQALVGQIERARDLIDALLQHHAELQGSEYLDELSEAIEELRDSLAALERADDAADDAGGGREPCAVPKIEIEIQQDDGTVVTHRFGASRETK